MIDLNKFAKIKIINNFNSIILTLKKKKNKIHVLYKSKNRVSPQFHFFLKSAFRWINPPLLIVSFEYCGNIILSFIIPLSLPIPPLIKSLFADIKSLDLIRLDFIPFELGVKSFTVFMSLFDLASLIEVFTPINPLFLLGNEFNWLPLRIKSPFGIFIFFETSYSAASFELVFRPYRSVVTWLFNIEDIGFFGWLLLLPFLVFLSFTHIIIITANRIKETKNKQNHTSSKHND